MDSCAAAGDLPPVLCPCGNAHLCCQHGRAVQLEQEGVWHGAGQLLLGLLLHPGFRRLCQWQVGSWPWASASFTDNSSGMNIMLFYFECVMCASFSDIWMLTGRKVNCEPGVCVSVLGRALVASCLSGILFHRLCCWLWRYRDSSICSLWQLM